MADRYSESPIRWAKRYIEALNFPTDEDRLHVRLFAKRFTENITDPLDQIVAMRLMCDYADEIAVRSRARTEPAGSDTHQQLTQQVAQIGASMGKWLRLAAFRRGKAGKPGRSKSAQIFTAPRERRPSELAAAVGKLGGGDAA